MPAGVWRPIAREAKKPDAEPAATGAGKRALELTQAIEAGFAMVSTKGLLPDRAAPEPPVALPLAFLNRLPAPAPGRGRAQ